MRIPVAMILFLVIITILCDSYILLDIKKYCNKAKKYFWEKFHIFLSLFLFVFLIVVLCLPRRNAEDGILTVMWALYAYATIYISKLVYVIVSLIGRLISRIAGAGKRQHNYCIVTGVVFSIAVFGVMWWGALVSRRSVEVVNVTVESDRLPASFNDFRIAQISDLHTGTWGNDTTFVSELVDSVNALHPDMIVFTGDIVNRETSEILPFVNVLSRLNAPYGVYSILGNHDYGDYITWENPSLREKNNRQLADIQRDMKWKLLNNSSEYIVNRGDTMVMIGVENWGEPPFKQYGKLFESYGNDSISDLNDNRFKVLLSHNPEHWLREVVKESNVDLTLSGHTHAMQFEIKVGDWKWSPAKYKYETWGGLYTRQSKDGRDMNLYVNIGSGEVGVPARIGATPEITLITLKRSE